MKALVSSSEPDRLPPGHGPSGRQVTLWADFEEDTRHGVRCFVADPLFALVAITLISLGIGATSAVFSVLRAVVIAPLPYPHAERLVSIAEVTQGGALSRVSWPNFNEMRERAESLRGVAAHSGIEPTAVVVNGQGFMVPASRASRELFQVLGVRMVEGSDLLAPPREDGNAVAVIVSAEFRDERIGNNASLRDTRIEINGRPATIVGVIPTSSAYPAGAHLWSNLESQPDSAYGDRTAHNFHVVGRLRSGLTLEAASRDMDT
jgi:putative ABC transport system permease protein